MDVPAVLADVARLGPFFTVRTGPAPAERGWRPLVDLYADPAPLRDRIEHVRVALGCPDRVAASIAFQGLAALLVSAPLAAVAVHGVLPRLTAAQLRWRPADTGPGELGCPDPAGTAVDGAGPGAAGLAGLLLAEHLDPLVAAVRAQVPIAPRVLWGNAASAVAGGKRLIGIHRPGAAGNAAAVARALLASGQLARTGELRAPTDPDRGWSFRRRSCCLYYRVPGGGLCGDCVLLAPC